MIFHGFLFGVSFDWSGSDEEPVVVTGMGVVSPIGIG